MAQSCIAGAYQHLVGFGLAQRQLFDFEISGRGVEHRCPDGVGHVVYLSHRERAEPVSGDSPKIKRRQGPRIGDLMKVSISPACGITVGYLRIVSAGRIGATSALYLVCGESNVGATQRW